MVDDLLLNKVAAIERAVHRVRSLSGGSESGAASQARDDARVLSLQRACEGAIDAAMHLVREHRLGVPQETREAFDFLEQARLIDPDLATRMRKMVELRNVMIHDYESLTHDVVHAIVSDRLDDFLQFTERMLGLALGSSNSQPSDLPPNP